MSKLPPNRFEWALFILGCFGVIACGIGTFTTIGEVPEPFLGFLGKYQAGVVLSHLMVVAGAISLHTRRYRDDTRRYRDDG